MVLNLHCLWSDLQLVVPIVALQVAAAIHAEMIQWRSAWLPGLFLSDDEVCHNLLFELFQGLGLFGGVSR